MPGGKTTAPKEDKGWSQANEISDAMLGIQPHSDDSMMFILRYGNQARVSMRQQDFKDFMDSIHSLMEMWSKPAESFGGAEARSQKAAELRQKCMDLVKDFPDLQRDFDRFTTASRATMRAFNGGQV